MVWTPRVTVAAVVERNGRFLLVEEDDAGRRVVNQPAGHLEAGESLIQAVRRETLEETGWDFEPTALVGLYRWVHPTRGLTFLRACFAGALTARHPDRPLDPDILTTVWLDRAALARRPLRSPMVLRCVDDYLAGRRYPLDLLADLPAETPGP
jgi:ADP-ribose pyrophosphatase YjhB (NUDIX family)